MVKKTVTKTRTRRPKPIVEQDWEPSDLNNLSEQPTLTLDSSDGFEVRNIDTNEYFFVRSRRGALEFLAGAGSHWKHFMITKGLLPSNLLYGGSLCQ